MKVLKKIVTGFREAFGSMMVLENTAMALHTVRANKMRSFLTMLGIVIGISSVISIVSIGDTMRGMFADLYKDVGITQAFVSIGSWVEDTRIGDLFSLEELKRIEEVFGEEIAYIDSNAFASGDALVKSRKMKMNFQGINDKYQNVQPVSILYGRYLNERDLREQRKNVVMEAKSAGRLFGTVNAVGKTFRTAVNGGLDEYTVVGVYEKKMSALQALVMKGSDDVGSAFMPETILTRPDDRFFNCHVFAAEGTDMEEFMRRLVAYVARLKRRNPEDFFTQTAVEQMGSVDTMMGNLSIAVGGIAAISLLVGGIGIMNIMLVSVTERTREIGIRKALGARTRDILIQFLTESAFLSALGGIIGVIVASGVLSLGGSLLGIPVIMKPAVMILAVSFSAVVGIFFGIYPASKAASADPIDALRYE